MDQISQVTLSKKSPTVAVTGASGYIGQRVVSRLVSEGHQVVALSRRPSSAPWPAESVRSIAASLSDFEELTRALSGSDVVYHLAGTGSPSSPASHCSDMIDTNVTGTLNVLRAAGLAGASRVVFASSAAVYGAIHQDPKRETMTPRPMSPYAVSKLAGEELCAMMGRRGDLETVVLRLFNVYGPDQTEPSQGHQFIPMCLRSLAEGRPITLRGGGHQTRDFVFIDDVVDAFMRAGTVPGAAGHVINVGTGVPVEIRHVLKTLAHELATTPIVSDAPPIEGEVLAATADTRRALQILGIGSLRPFEAGIRHVLQAQKDIRETA